MATTVSPSIFLPTPPEVYDRTWMNRMLESINKRLSTYVSKETANESVLLISNTGKTYKITVADDGTLTSTLVSG